VSVGVETRDRPCVAPADPPVSQPVPGEPVVTMAPVGRARPPRAKRSRTVVQSLAVPVEAGDVPIPIAPIPALTPREAQLLTALAADPGASSAALGGSLGIAAGTVRKALGALREKLGAGKDADGAALVALARARRLLADHGVVVTDGGEPG